MYQCKYYIILSIICLISVLSVYLFVFSPRFDKKEPPPNHTELLKTLKTKQTDSKNGEKQNITSYSEIKNNDENEDDDEIITKNDRDYTNKAWCTIYKSPEFISLTIWSSFYMLTKYFYITTLEWITNDNEEEINISI